MNLEVSFIKTHSFAIVKRARDARPHTVYMAALWSRSVQHDRSVDLISLLFHLILSIHSCEDKENVQTHSTACLYFESRL